MAIQKMIEVLVIEFNSILDIQITRLMELVLILSKIGKINQSSAN